MVVGVLGNRNAHYFDGPPTEYGTYDYPLTADAALAELDARYAHWLAGVRALNESALRAPCGEEGHEDAPMAALVLHIHRELVHHLAEVALLRDLWAHGAGQGLDEDPYRAPSRGGGVEPTHR